MVSWLKAAEDLFEVVDRRAKLVAREKSDEQLNLQTPASNGRGSPAKRRTPKAQKKLNSEGSSATVENEREATNSETFQSESRFDTDKSIPMAENSAISHSPSDATVNEEKHNSDGAGVIEEAVEQPSSGAILNEEAKHGSDQTEAASSDQEEVASKSNDERTHQGSSDALEGSSSFASKEVEVVHGDSPDDSDHKVLEDTGSPQNIKHEVSEIPSADALSKAATQPKGGDLKTEPGLDMNCRPESKNMFSDAKVLEQLDEAQGLLNSAVSTGQSKEARLARVCAGLSSRLQEYKSENAQLEELLVSERELSKSYEEHIKQLQKDLSVSRAEVMRVESNLVDALAAKNAEIEALVNSMDSMKKQAALSEGNLASVQANMESIMRNRELTETRMMQALREELAVAERRAEEEHAAHNATKMAAMEREVELEHRAIESSTVLARIQRTADERTARASELEQKLALLEVECASLNQELQDMEARIRRGQKKPPEEANQVIQAWQEEVERARQAQRDAESKLSSMEAEVQKMRVEMAAMKRDAEHYSRQEHMELEKRYRELTDLLYYKQTQLETMASEKAAAEFQLEKELKLIQEAQVEAESNKVSRRASSSWEDDTEMKALETLPLHHRHMAGASIQLQKAAKLLDSGAVRAIRFLWRYPTARVMLLFYLVFVHLFLMYLLHRLQEQADTYSFREVAESMGLGN